VGQLRWHERLLLLALVLVALWAFMPRATHGHHATPGMVCEPKVCYVP